MLDPLTPCQSGVSDLQLAQVSSFCEYPHHGLNLFAYIIAPPSLRLDFGSSAQCPAVNLWICFHQLPDEGSMMTIKVVINPITGEGQFRHPFCYCLGSQLGSSLWIPGNFSSARFLASPIMAPSIKISLSLLSLFALPLSQSSCSLMLSSPLSFSPPPPLLPSILLSPQAPNFLNRSCLFPLPCMFLLGFSLLPSFSQVVDYRLVILCFTSNSHLWVSTVSTFFWGKVSHWTISSPFQLNWLPHIQRCTTILSFWHVSGRYEHRISYLGGQHFTNGVIMGSSSHLMI